MKQESNRGKAVELNYLSNDKISFPESKCITTQERVFSISNNNNTDNDDNNNNNNNNNKNNYNNNNKHFGKRRYCW